jgi:xanthine dehydrogenase accessory factor
MTDLEPILPLWRELEASGSDYVLATVVGVEGPSYRKPGAHMLLAQDGRRAGTVSGGCLEAEVARRAWWLTSTGPVVSCYSTVEDDDERPFGSGCGGVVFLMLERKQTAGPLMTALQAAFHARTPLGIATVLEGPHIGRRFVAGLDEKPPGLTPVSGDRTGVLVPELQRLANLALDNRAPIDGTVYLDGVPIRILADYRPARPGLWIFSAGDDVEPLVILARQLGWFVAIADGRSHLATRERFPSADEVRVLPIFDLPEAAPKYLSLRPTDAAVVMTHSFEQDARILASLLALEFQLAYLGALGPQRRTRELLAEAARLLHLSEPTNRAERWLAQLHAPTGLDLGADTPSTIALSILAEIQKTLTAATGKPLHQVRATTEIVAP